MAALSIAESKLRAARMSAWTLRGRTIGRTFDFRTFKAAMRFVSRVASEAERRDHHPDIDIRWNRVTLALSTHSEGGLTPKDFSAARAFDGIFRGRAR